MDSDKNTAVLANEKESIKAVDAAHGPGPVLEPVYKQPKDIWDKLGAIAPIVSGMLIFVMGGYFTYSFNQQQLHLQEIQTIERFIPHLMGNDQSKRAAILAISSLTNAELAGKFAQIFASKGTVSALQSMAENGSESDKSAASTALAKALENIAARESKLNEMETAFQQALNEKNVQGAPVSDSTGQVDEADRLEHLADMCRARGQIPVAESLLRQAVNIRIRVQLPNDAKDVVGSLKKLSELEQAAGNKDEVDSTLSKIARIEAKFGLSQSASSSSPALPLPPPPPASHDAVGQVNKPVTGKSSEESREAQNGNTETESKTEKEATANSSAERADKSERAERGSDQNRGANGEATQNPGTAQE